MIGRSDTELRNLFNFTFKLIRENVTTIEFKDGNVTDPLFKPFCKFIEK